MKSQLFLPSQKRQSHPQTKKFVVSGLLQLLQEKTLPLFARLLPDRDAEVADERCETVEYEELAPVR